MRTSPVRSRHRLRTLITIVATAAVIAPAAALANHSFTDVGDGEFYHTAVDWMLDNDVTAGCNPPSNTKYCPEDFVTRGQMAVFFERLDSKNVFLRPGDVSMSDGGGDAETLDGKDSTAFLGATAKAVDADRLDGKDSSAFLGANEQATDSDTVDGKHASDFLGAGDIVLSHQRNWWVQSGDAATVGHFTNVPVLQSASASDLFHTELLTPAVIGATSYGLKSVEVCYNAVDGSSKIDTTEIRRSTTHNSGSTVATDTTDRTSVWPVDECYTVSVNDTPPSTATYRLSLQVDGSVRLVRVSATFTPV